MTKLNNPKPGDIWRYQDHYLLIIKDSNGSLINYIIEQGEINNKGTLENEELTKHLLQKGRFVVNIAQLLKNK